MQCYKFQPYTYQYDSFLIMSLLTALVVNTIDTLLTTEGGRQFLTPKDLKTVTTYKQLYDTSRIIRIVVDMNVAPALHSICMRRDS